MIESHGRHTAITLSAGIDSVVLAYWYMANLDKMNFLSPTPYPPDFKPEVYVCIYKH